MIEYTFSGGFPQTVNRELNDDELLDHLRHLAQEKLSLVEHIKHYEDLQNEVRSPSCYDVYVQQCFRLRLYHYHISRSRKKLRYLTRNNQISEKCDRCVFLFYKWNLQFFWLTTKNRHGHNLVLMNFTIKQLEMV